MVLQRKEYFNPELRKQLGEYVYDIVGYMLDITKELPCGLPEYIYQEALDMILKKHGVKVHKEYQHHPVFMGKQMNSYLKTDFMIERERGNIVIECKAIEKIGAHERQQLFSYLIGCNFPIGILVNFAHYPTPYIEKYYFDRTDMTITPF